MTLNRPIGPQKTDVSLIIPAHESTPALEQCIAAIKEMVPLPDELIIVADGGNASVCAAARRANAILIKTPAPLGPAGARNLGAKAASGDLLFFVDSDVAVSFDAIDTIQNAMQSETATDAIIGSYDTRPPHTNFLSQYKNLVHHFVHQTGNPNANTFFGACGVIRRDIFLEMGGFDERYSSPCIEDIELGYRLKDAGYKILLLKTLQVTHLKQWRPMQLLFTDFYCRAIPWSRLILTSKRMDNDLNIDWAARLKVLLTLVLLCQLIGMTFTAAFGFFAVLTATFLVAADWKLLTFFFQHKGVWFTVRVPLWHWFYYAYSGVAFGFVLVEHWVGKPARMVSGGAIRRKRAW